MRAWQQTWIFWAVGALILTTTPSFAVQSNGGPGGHGGVVGGAQSPGLGSPSPVMGTPEVVFYGGSSPGSCDAYDLPDMAARAWRDINGTVTLAVSWATSRFSTGPSLGSVKHSCDVVFNSTMSGDNSLYADHEWMCSAYMCDDNVTVMGYMHQEFHGWEHGNCSVPSRGRAAVESCWMVAMTSTISHDGGKTFVHTAEPPGHLVAAAPIEYDPDHSQFGYGDPSGIIRHRDDGFYYTTLHSRTDHGPVRAGTGLMRTADVRDWKSWRCWNGTAFSVEFVDPYAVPRPDPATLNQHVCAPIPTLGFTVLQLRWSDHFSRYIAVGEGNYRLPNGTLVFAFLYALSEEDDAHLTRWESPAKLLRPGNNTLEVSEGYAAILDEHSLSTNFETIGRQAHFYYTRHTHDTSGPCSVPPGCRDLMRQPIDFGELE
eukprot:m.75884 g.75884  ORF g.75884 m.75884 type:complete len:429 (+) comp18994_c0_seq1:2963-4249(+)